MDTFLTYVITYHSMSISDLWNGLIKAIFTTLETINHTKWLEMLRSNIDRGCLLAITYDEAHRFSKW